MRRRDGRGSSLPQTIHLCLQLADALAAALLGGCQLLVGLQQDLHLVQDRSCVQASLQPLQSEQGLTTAS